MQLPDSLTKQGVRDLNALGPQKKRASTEVSKRKDDGQPAAAQPAPQPPPPAEQTDVPTIIPTGQEP